MRPPGKRWPGRENGRFREIGAAHAPPRRTFPLPPHRRSCPWGQIQKRYLQEGAPLSGPGSSNNRIDRGFARSILVSSRIMNMNTVDTLWSLWAATGLWAGGGKRAAFSTGRPQDCAQRKGGNRRSRLSTNPQRPRFRARRCSQFYPNPHNLAYQHIAR